MERQYDGSRFRMGKPADEECGSDEEKHTGNPGIRWDKV